MNRKFVVFLVIAGVAGLGAVALSARAKTPVNVASNLAAPASGRTANSSPAAVCNTSATTPICWPSMVWTRRPSS